MRCFISVMLIAFAFGMNAQKNLDVLFYNVENLFDTLNDSLTNDEEFLPDSERHWNQFRYREKLNNIARSILISTEWETPGLIGLCEVENASVLNDLICNSPLKSLQYKSIHRESYDRRGIDVALLYQKDQFKILKTIFFPHPEISSRDILYAKGVIGRNDTLHVFVNHWPSRYGGAMRSEPLRQASAYQLRQKVDSICGLIPGAMILIMGDFNDYPRDESLYECLKAKESGHLRNMALLADNFIGSYKMNGRWGYLDQFIVSENLTNEVGGWYVNPMRQVVLHPSILLEEDAKYHGLKPKRSWIGYHYQNGFSDHLPVLLHLQKR